MMLVELTTVPQSALPVAALKDHLRLGSGFSDDGLQDDLLDAYLRAAIATIEARTGKILIEREFGWNVTSWRDDQRQPLPMAPVSAIVAIVLVNRHGEETPLDPDLAYLEADMQRPILVARGSCLPVIPPTMSIRVEVMAGFGPEWGDLPSDLRQAVLMLAAHFYEYRQEQSTAGLPYGVAALIERYRTVRIMMGGGS